MRDVYRDTFWSAVPEILLHHLGVNDDKGRSFFAYSIRNFLRGILPFTGPSVYLIGPYLSISTSIQHDRVLKPVLKKISEQYGAISKIRLPRLRITQTIRLLLEAEKLHRSIRQCVREKGSQPLGSLGELLGQTAVLHARFGAYFASIPHSCVALVATQHGASVRAALRAAQSNPHIRSVYLPHAPFASNIFYGDLPVHFAFLRGEAEFEKYSEMTDLQDQLRVVGDPSKPDLTSSQLAGDAFLYVVSDHRPKSIGSEVEIIRSSGVSPIEVCPHPRMERNIAFFSLFPQEWTISPYRTTYERIAAGGVRAVIQRNSGSGLDVMLRGIPVINLAVPGIALNYPYLLTPEVNQARTPEELAQVARSLERSAQSDQLRINAAERWVAAVGGSALNNISDQLRSVLDSSHTSSLIFDAWKRS